MEGVGELRLGMETELKNGRDEAGSWLLRDLDLSLEINLENEVLRNFGRYLGDLDFASLEASEFDLFLADSLRMSSASSTEDTFESPWFLQ